MSAFLPSRWQIAAGKQRGGNAFVLCNVARIYFKVGCCRLKYSTDDISQPFGVPPSTASSKYAQQDNVRRIAPVVRSSANALHAALKPTR
jgi:hypothetical protein